MEIITDDIESQPTQINVSKIIPISPDIKEYNLLDKSKVEIIQPEETSQETKDNLYNLFYRSQDQEQVSPQEEKSMKIDPWLNKNY